MASEIEAWALTEARHIFLNGVCRCTEEPCSIHLAIAGELQAQRWMGEKIGRRGREADIDAAEQRGREQERAAVVRYLRTWRVRKKGEPDSACLHVEKNADAIERGEHRRESA